MSHMCKRIFKIRASIKKLLTKYQIFTILPQISHFHKFRNFLKYICNFWDQLLHPYKFYGRDMSGILFFVFASCHPLKGPISVWGGQIKEFEGNTKLFFRCKYWLVPKVQKDLDKDCWCTLVESLLLRSLVTPKYTSIEWVKRFLKCCSILLFHIKLCLPFNLLTMI